MSRASEPGGPSGAKQSPGDLPGLYFRGSAYLFSAAAITLIAEDCSPAVLAVPAVAARLLITLAPAGA